MDHVRGCREDGSATPKQFTRCNVTLVGSWSNQWDYIWEYKYSHRLLSYYLAYGNIPELFKFYLLVQEESTAMIVLLQELVLSLGSLVRDHLRVQLGLKPPLVLCQIPEEKKFNGMLQV